MTGQLQSTDVPGEHVTRRSIIPIRKNGRAGMDDARLQGRAFWKRWAAYHTRSRIKAKMRCLKAFGERILARDPNHHAADIRIGIAPMNHFNALGSAEIVRLE